MTRDAPKFWDDKKQRVVEGVVSTFSPCFLDWGTDTGTQEICKTPTQLADILGTYVWVYSGDPEFGGDVEEMHRSYSKDDTDFITRHSITLSAEHPSQPVALKNVNGHITWGTLQVAFDGVRRVRERWSSDAAVSWMESFWEVLLTEDEDSEDNEPWLDVKGNAVGAAVVLDDNGCPFLVFDWSHPPGCHSSWSGYYVGKRLVKGKEWRLTDEERGRLGIGSTFRSVAQVKGGSLDVYDDDDDEDEEEEEESDYGGSDEEDVDASGKNGEDTVSEAVGEKRKASNGETGANKRRRA